MNNQNYTETIFNQLNDHLRSSEQKQLQLTTTYLGALFGLLITTLTNSKMEEFFKPSIFKMTINVIFLIFGIAIYVLQRWYRIWKEHYIEVLYSIVEYWEIDIKYRPYWLKNIQYKSNALNIDNILYYLTFITNILVLALLCVNIFYLEEIKLYKIIIIGIIIFIYTAIIFIFHRKIIKSIPQKA